MYGISGMYGIYGIYGMYGMSTMYGVDGPCLNSVSPPMIKKSCFLITNYSLNLLVYKCS